jgi:hypothetical protein
MEGLPHTHAAVGLQAACPFAGHRPREPCNDARLMQDVTLILEGEKYG